MSQCTTDFFCQKLVCFMYYYIREERHLPPVNVLTGECWHEKDHQRSWRELPAEHWSSHPCLASHRESTSWVSGNRWSAWWNRNMEHGTLNVSSMQWIQGSLCPSIFSCGQLYCNTQTRLQERMGGQMLTRTQFLNTVRCWDEEKMSKRKRKNKSKSTEEEEGCWPELL